MTFGCGRGEAGGSCAQSPPGLQSHTTRPLPVSVCGCRRPEVASEGRPSLGAAPNVLSLRLQDVLS